MVLKPKIRRLIKEQNNCCFYCGLPFTTLKIVARNRFQLYTLDHFIPKIKGGANSILNMVLCCKRCNSKKGDRLPTACEIEKFKKQKGNKLTNYASFIRED
jgi:5-methylcytosine-specific restriction endonuclease McrA